MNLLKMLKMGLTKRFSDTKTNVATSDGIKVVDIRLAGNTRDVIIHLRPSGKIIHTSNHTDEDNLDVLIESMEIEAEDAIDDVEEQVYLEIAKYLESMQDINERGAFRLKNRPKYKHWSLNEIDELKRLYPRMATVDVAKKLNRRLHSVTTKATSLGLKKDRDFLSRQKMASELYAMYKGDELLVMGTLEEIAKHQNMTIGNVRFMTYPSYHNRSESEDRRLVFKLED